MMARLTIDPGEQDGEKRQHQADNLEERIEWRDHEHAVKEDGVLRQFQNCESGAGQAQRRHQRNGRLHLLAFR